ncbi:MAG: serine protease [Pyrinomonadaceae bacterium]
MKTKFVLLLAIAIFCASAAYSQSRDNASFKVVVVDKGLNLKNVPKFVLIVRKSNDSAFGERRVSTSFDGSTTLELHPGDYTVTSENEITLDDKAYRWEHAFKVEAGKYASIELSNDNAKVSNLSLPRRRVSETAELFKTLRDGVVTIEGELQTGSGFIFDEKGLVLTNYHVINESTEIRVRFDKQTAVKARLLAKDIERDLAILQINLSAFAGGKVLKLAAANAAEAPVFEGEQVFTIGSPANQEKILSTGIVSKVEDRAIISDINFSAGNAGGPLFNSVGEVVGLMTFKVKDRKDKGDSGLAGIVRIEEVADLIAKARELAAAKRIPSGKLMPNIPEGTFPVETIKTAVRSPQFSPKQYVSDVKNYQVRYMTPVYKFYMIEKDRIESLKIREKRNKQKGELSTADMFRDLSIWSEYAGELMPVVDILALPETMASGKSMALAAITTMTVGMSTPLDLKYKADFSQMKLLCDGQEVTPVRRNKTEIERDLQSYYKTKKRFTYAGVYTYPYDIFAPGRCTQMAVHVFSEEDIETPIVSTVTDAIKNRIWTDFGDFRTRIARVQ